MVSTVSSRSKEHYKASLLSSVCLGVEIMVLPLPPMPFMMVIMLHLLGEHLPVQWRKRTQIIMSSLPDLHNMDVTNDVATLCL